MNKLTTNQVPQIAAPEYAIEVLPEPFNVEYTIEVLAPAAAPAPSTAHVVHVGGTRMVLTQRGRYVYAAAVAIGGILAGLFTVGVFYFGFLLAGTA